MILRWERHRVLADREMIAALYEVSIATVRRHCRPVRPGQPGRPRPDRTTVAMYDALAAADALADVAPRPERTRAALRYRMTCQQEGNAS